MADKSWQRHVAVLNTVGSMEMYKEEDLDVSGKHTPYLSGGILRALRAGGERAARAVTSLHRKFYHASAATMKRLLDTAGVPDEVVNDVEDIISPCKVCRTWQRPCARPVGRLDLALDINKKVFGDLPEYAPSVFRRNVYYPFNGWCYYI